jgi:hypothetical protein
MGDVATFEAPGLKQQMGIGAGRQTLAGVVGLSVVPVSTVGAGAQTLLSALLKKLSLSENGKAVKLKAFGTSTGVAGTRTMQLKFGATVVAQLIIAPAGSASSWFLEAVVARTGAVTQVSGGFAMAPGDFGPACTTPAENNDAADIPITVVGNCTNVADAIVAKGLVVEFLN